MNFEIQYKSLIKKILERGVTSENRTGVDTLKLFFETLTIDLTKGFPIVTGKKIFFDKAYHEYQWIMSGSTYTTYLKKHGIHWWDEFADKNGYLGKTYGYQLRNYNGEVDQIQYVINQFNFQPNTRRAHITLWNPSELNEVVLPVCYTDFTFVKTGGYLNMTMDFRSSDVFLGLPYDICVGALLLIDMAKFLNLKPYKLGIKIDDAHIYKNHTKQCGLYLKRDIYPLPALIEDKLDNYRHGSFIKATLNN